LANNHLDVFDGTFTPTTVTGGFLDPTVPATHHAFNIQNLGGSLYVTYAKIDPMTGESVDAPGEGFVRKFDTNGVKDTTFVSPNVNSGGVLDSPWGLVIAPSSFGIFGGALLVGNFADEGNINAFNPTTGAFLGTLKNESGNNVEIDELWALIFGNGGNGGDPNTLYFTSGLGEEEHGLFGKLNPTTAQATNLIQFATENFAVDEAGGHVDFTVVRSGDTSGTSTVNFNTFDESQPGHASQKSDYEISLSKLTFAPGETSKTFRILVVNDNFVEGDETVSLALSNPTGAGVGLGSPNDSELTILDDDGAPAPVLYGNFVRDTQALQKDFVFGQPGADAQLEANKVAYFNEFVTRPEFVAKYPSTLTNDQYVDALLASANLTPSQVRLFVVSLTNSQEVPPTVPTTSTGAARPASFGTARFQFNNAQTAMTFNATINNI